MMKGAPEMILSRCSHVSIDGQIKEIDESFRLQCQVNRRFNFNVIRDVFSMLGSSSETKVVW